MGAGSEACRPRDSRKVTTPLTKERLEDVEMDDALLSEEETKLCRSLTMRILIHRSWQL